MYINYIPCINYKINDDDNKEDNCIFIVGGDGSVSITIQNIIKDSNFEDLMIPIYICPFGSGNGLAKNLNIDPYDLRLNGNKKYVNAIEIDDGEKLTLSFLSQTWGVISDIDFNTEYLRCFGDFRFYFGILKNIFFPNYYQGELNINTNWDTNYTMKSEFYLFCATNAPWISSDFKLGSNADISSNEIDILYIDQRLSFFDRVKLIYSIMNETIHELEFVNYFKVDKYKLEILKNNSKIASDGELIDSNIIKVKSNGKNFYFILFNFYIKVKILFI